MDFVGIDLHKTSSQICILSEDGELTERRIKSTRAAFDEVFAARPRARILVEASTESEWVAGQLGRPIAKAWNAITSASFAEKGVPAGTAGRIAIPVAAEGARERDVAMTLVDETGLDAVYSGTLAESWRQQPGSPCYCTDLSREEMPAALASAERARLPRRRELAIEAIMERVGDSTTNPDSDYAVRLTRALFM